MSNPFIESYEMWNGQLATEILLQQLYGMYRANIAAKEYELAKKIKYAYKVRLRPDTAIVKPIPPIDTINFHDDKCSKVILSLTNISYILLLIPR